MKTKEQYLHLLADFQRKRGALYGITHLGIFGSVARGEQTVKSDVDICYEGEPLSLFKIVALKEELEDLFNCPVDVVRIRESMNLLLKKRIINDGIYV